MIVLTIITLGLAAYLYSIRCLNAPISSRIRVTLAAFRGVFLLVLLYLLTYPQVREILKVTSSPRLYVALDDSLSMEFPSDPPAASGKMGPSRWETTIRQLRDDGLIEAWERKGFQMRYLLLSNAITDAPGAATSWSSRFPRSATPVAYQTNLSAAIDKFSEALSPNESAYLLLFTDGQWNLGRNPIAAAAQLTTEVQGSRPPIYTFGVGPAAAVRDVIVDSIQLPSTARSGESLQLKAHLLARGVAPGTAITLHVRGETSGGDQVVDLTQKLTVPPDGEDLFATFDLPKLERGQYLFTARAESFEGEWVESNNQLTRGIQIRDAKDGVLLLSSAPDWEFKYLKRTLENQDKLEVHAYLSHENGLNRLGDREWVNQHSKAPEAEAKESAAYASLEELQEDLARWPVIVLHNFTFTVERVEFARQLKNYIENGGGVIFLPGVNNEVKLPQALWNLLPSPLNDSFAFAERATIAKTSLEPNDPFANLAQDVPGLDLPPLNNQVTPRNPTGAGKILLQGMAAMNESVPLATLYRYGLGRIVVLGSQSFWRWNLLTGRDVLTPFWLTVLYQGCPRLQSQSGEIQIDGYLFNAYDKVRIAWRMGERIGDATASAVPLDVKGPSRPETIWLAPAGDAPGVFETQYTPTEPGTYQVASWAHDASAEFRVENTAIEYRDLRQNISDLRELARIGGGEYSNQPAWKELANRLPLNVKTIREDRIRFLGEKWWMATLLILFLGCEWFMRWKKGMP